MAKVMLARWSAIRSWRKCQYQYFNRYIRRLVSNKPAVPLIRGSIIGEMLDKVAEGKSTKPVVEKYEKEYKKLFREERETYGDIVSECSRIVKNYRTLYKNDGLDYSAALPDGMNPYEIEVINEFSIGGLKIRFQGHIDKLPYEERRDLTLVMDHKTHKVIPDSNARFSDLQLLTYDWLLPRSNLEITPNGILWDYLRTKPPTIPEQLKNGQLTKRQNLDSDYLTYMAEIKRLKLDPADYTDVLERLKESSDGRYFERVLLPSPSREMVKEAVKDFKETLIQINEVSNRGTFVKNLTRDCTQCGFYDLCSAEIRGLDIEFILKSRYAIMEGDAHTGTKRRITSIKDI